MSSYVKVNKQYEKIEYIEGTGTQYIDTGFKPNNNTRVLLDIDILSTSPTTASIFGSRTETSSASFTLWKISATAFRDDYAKTTKNVTLTPSGRFLIDKNKNVLKINNTTYNTATSSTFQSNSNLTLLATNSNNVIDNRMIYGKIYSCKIYDNDILIRNYIPVKNGSVYGLYDLVENKFYQSVNGEFVGGNSTGEIIDFELWREISEIKMKMNAGWV